MIITAIIVDDELFARKALNMMIEQTSYELEVVAMAKNVAEAERLIEVHKPNIVFLDVEMPGYNGFELLERIDNIDFEVIFTTAHEEYAVQAFRASCIDYLVKPINPIQLSEAIAKYKDLSMLKNFKQRHSLFKEVISQPEILKDKIGISTVKGFYVLDYDDIVFVKSCSTFIEIHTLEGDIISSSKRLKEIEELSNGRFFRSHRSYLINLKYCREYVKSDEVIKMINNLFLPLSSRAKKDFLSLLKV